MVNVLGYSEIKTAIAVTPMPALGALLAPVVGKLLDHVSPRVPAALGMLAMAAGLLLLRQLDAGATLWDVSWRTLLLGVGLGFAMPSLAVAGMSAVPHRAGGAGSGAINWSRQMGFVLGVAVLVAVFTHSMTSAMTGAVDDARTVAVLSAGAGETGAAADPLAGAPQAPAGSPQAEQQATLKTQLGALFSTARADAFDLPFLAAAVIALVGVVPALLLERRRRVTADEGDESDVWGSVADVA
jgi:hypothetical protein